MPTFAGHPRLVKFILLCSDFSKSISARKIETEKEFQSD